MEYLITFLEGVISFISPCMLPLLPVYVSYFAGGSNKIHKTFTRALAFILGFTLVFCMMGVFAGTFGAFVVKYQTYVNVVCGSIVILFGLSYLNIIHISFFHGFHNNHEVKSVFSAFVFGLIFSVSHTPCVGAFLGSAIMMASSSGTVMKGIFLLLAYSLGMGIPFLVFAVLIDKLTSVINSIRKHYAVINIACGIFLVIVGFVMITGVMGEFLAGLQHVGHKH